MLWMLPWQTVARKIKIDASLVNEHGANGQTPLMVASVRGDPMMVKLLLDNGAKPWLPDKADWTALHYAVLKDHLTVVRRQFTLHSAMGTQHLSAPSPYEHRLVERGGTQDAFRPGTTTSIRRRGPSQRHPRQGWVPLRAETLPE
eukprot:1183782-Prorocentrum_minimum.AAC.5